MNKAVKHIVFSVLLGLGVTLALYAGTKGQDADRQTICNDIIVTFTNNEKQLITGEDIAKLLKTKNINPIGQPYYKIQAKVIEDAVEKHPTVRNAECYKTPGGAIKLTIKQRTPVLRVMGKQNYYVDEERRKMPVSINFAVYVPVVTGNVSEEMATGKLFDFCEYINKDSFWNNQIVQINIDEQKKIQLVPRIGNHVIEMGHFDRYEAKLKKLRKMYLYGLNEIGWNIYSTINIEYKDQVVCTRK